MTDDTPKRVKLHRLIGGRTAWTDELWQVAYDDLLATLPLDEAMQMYKVIYPTSIAVAIMPLEVLLLEFRKWPPTVLLGVFDLVLLVSTNPKARDRWLSGQRARR